MHFYTATSYYPACASEQREISLGVHVHICTCLCICVHACMRACVCKIQQTRDLSYLKLVVKDIMNSASTDENS